MKKRLLSMLLALVLALSLLPAGAGAVRAGKVRVVVENTTLRQDVYESNGKKFLIPWYDLLLDTEVDFKSGVTSTADAALKAACSQFNVDLQYDDDGLYSVGGLQNWGTASWVYTVNDWAAAPSERLQAGDTVCIRLTMNRGADIGTKATGDKGLRSLTFDYGVLYPAFAHDVTDYTLYVPHDVAAVTLSPNAADKTHKVFVTAKGEKAGRWGARSAAVSAGEASVTVDGGMTYTVHFVPMRAPAPKPTIEPASRPCSGGSDCPSGAFTDMDHSATCWYHPAVDWAVTNGVTTGTGKNTFGPEASCTRAQMVTFLWRAVGKPAPSMKKITFTDVPAGAYYSDAVLWAVEKGITNGVGNNRFAPENTVTRGQTVTFLWRMEGEKTVSGAQGFSDVPADAYYTKAVAWAVVNGITNGVGGGRFAPEDSCTRAQIVTFLWRDRVPAEQRAAALAAADDPLAAAQAYLTGSVPEPKCAADDWAVFDLARNAEKDALTQPDAYLRYYADLEAAVQAAKGKLSFRSAEEAARIVLAVTAQGYNAADVAGCDLTEKLSDQKFIRGEGVMGAVWALLALDSGGYASYARPEYVLQLQNAQRADGGFAPDGAAAADPAMTAMAVHALAPYTGESAVASTVRRALLCLSELPLDTLDDTAQTALVCRTLETLPDQPFAALQLSAMFSREIGGKTLSLQDNLAAFRRADGGFAAGRSDAASGTAASELGLRALTAERCAALGTVIYRIR